uniref:ATP synthase complex subunit 8 n=1 Tax=Chioglossa lusitanica TaxID=156857 RepID=B8R6G3_9SALA|nr:ATP synthase F0 subunit 8 [Chioglossa lusitanica]
MPQLNPGPWFAIFMVSWLIYLAFIMPKVMKFIYQNKPTLQNIKKENPQSWNWPWY